MMPGSTTERGLGWSHQRAREFLLKTTPDGTPCPYCGLPMLLTVHKLDADHSQPRSLGGTRADRLAHASCNRSHGNGTRPRRRHRSPVNGRRPQPTATPAPAPRQPMPATTRDWFAE